MSVGVETRRQVEAAEAAMRSGDHKAAVEGLVSLLGELHHPDTVYDEWVRLLAMASHGAGRPAMAAYAWSYLLEHERAMVAFGAAGLVEDSARCRLRAGDAAGAAAAFESVGAHARAAVAWETAGRTDEAARAWERAASRFDGAGDAYRTALSLTNLGLARIEAGDAHGNSTLSRAMVLLEEEADQAETRGATARALACYHTLIHIGRVTGTHENLAEGFLNCIRLMRSQGHRFFALQYYNDLAEASLEAGEHQAAAEVLREASEFCRRSGMLYADELLARAAAAFSLAAEAHLASGARVELAENALLAALDCHNRRADAGRVRAVYEKLAELPLGEARRERYRRLAERAPEGSSPEAGWPFRGYFAEGTAYPPTWRTDLVEADTEADPLAPVPATIGDLGFWDVVRRRCLLIVLARELHGRHGTDPEWRSTLAAELGRLGAPIALAPLGRLFDEGPALVRATVAAALRFLPFRGSLDLVGRALEGTEAPVREAALGALRYLVFPGAFVPLVRLYRDHPAYEVRRQVVLSIGRLAGMMTSSSTDALDFLVHTLREGVDPLLEEDLRLAIAGNATEGELKTLERHLVAEPDGEIHRFLQRVATRIETRRVTRAMGL